MSQSHTGRTGGANVSRRTMRADHTKCSFGSVPITDALTLCNRTCFHVPLTQALPEEGCATPENVLLERRYSNEYT